MKKYLKRFFNTVFVQNILCGLFARHCLCLMLHRVNFQDEKRIFPNENMKISPQFLEQFIVDAKNKGYTFISLDELVRRIKEKRSIYKTIVLTFDDGYADNYWHAFPILLKYKIPFAIYLSTSFIESKTLPWWYQLENLLLQNDEVNWNNKLHKAVSTAQKNKLFMLIRNELLANYQQIDSRLNELIATHVYNLNQEESLFLDWSQINKMLESGLLTLGNHTHNHANLDKLSIAEIRSEIAIADELIRLHSGVAASHFCYPYGELNLNLCHEIQPKFHSATTTDSGFIWLNYLNYLEKLPRYFFTEGKMIENIVSEIACGTRFGFRQKKYQ